MSRLINSGQMIKERLGAILFCICAISGAAFAQPTCDPRDFEPDRAGNLPWKGQACINWQSYLTFPGGVTREQKELASDIMSLDHRAHEQLGPGTPEWKEVLGMLGNAANAGLLYGDVEAGRLNYSRAEQAFLGHIRAKNRDDAVLTQLWREHQLAVIGASAAIVVVLGYAGVLGLMLLFAPARLARVGGASGLEDVPKPSGPLGFVYGLVRKGLEQITLPYLCRHPRVRRAWTKRYREGRATLRELGKPARESFVTEPEVLDAWVQRRVQSVLMALDRLELFRQRRIYVELPVRTGERQGGPIIERPGAEALREYFARQRVVVVIVGGGGSGKSTLACAMARWAIADDPSERLMGHRMLPVFIVEDTTDLVTSVIRNLRRMLGDEELPDDLVRGLLAKQRLLVIVDALSEREPATQRHVEQSFGEDASLNAIVITSRTEPMLGAVDRATLYPVRLDAAHVVPFIIGYLDRMEHSEGLKDGRVQLRLGERILALAEAAGRRTPVTPLLVTLFVNSAVDRAVEGGSFDDMPDAVPEVFVDYLRRLNSGGPQAAGVVPDDLFIQAAQILAVVSLGPNLVPQDFSRHEAADALARGGTGDQAQSMIDRLIASGLIERRMPGGIPILRFSLDPAAEYLAGIRKLFELKGVGQQGWHSYLGELTQHDGYPDLFDGYLTALAVCYRAYRRDFNLPEIHFPWEDEGKDPHPGGRQVGNTA